jgi:hypothetical protein
MSSTPWINESTNTSQFIGAFGGQHESSLPGWNPVNFMMFGPTITYSDSDTWQFDPEKHVFRINHDGVAQDVLQIQLPIMANLYQQSALWFFWLGNSVEGAVLQFAALADSSSINGVAGPNATYDFECDGDRHLFVVLAVAGGYYIKLLQGRNVEIEAGTGIEVSGGGAEPWEISAFAGVPLEFSSTTVASATTFYGSNGAGNATETSVNGLLISQDGVISDLYVKTAANVTATSHTFTVRKGAAYGSLADTALTCAILSGAASGSDTTNSVVVAAGDILTLKDVQDGTPEAVATSISVLFRPSAV